MTEDDTVDAFTAKLNGYATKAKELGKTLDESLLVRKLLDSTPDRFIQIVASIEQTNDLDDITLDEIIGKLKAFEERIKLRKEDKNKLLTRRLSNRNRIDTTLKEESLTHKGKPKWNKREWDMSKIQCHKCRKFRHFRKDCKESSTTQEQSNLILEDEEPSLLMATHETEHKEILLNEGQIQPRKYATTDASIWYLDNGASNHMTGTKSHFRDIDESITGRVRFGDGSYVEIKGRGSILLGCRNHEQKIVSDVYYIPNLKSNILSLGQLTEIGCQIIMDGNKLTLYDKNKKLLMKGCEVMEVQKPWDWDNNREETSTQGSFWASFVVEGVDNGNTTQVNSENNDNTYQEQEPITAPDSPTNPPTYNSNHTRQEAEEATSSSTKRSENGFDDTPVRGFKDLTEIYENAREVETKNLLFTEEEPRNYKEASTNKKWIEAMEIELDSINKNNTWTLTTLPTNHKAIGLKWLFKTKRDAKGEIIKYKARLMKDKFDMSDLGLLAYYLGIEVTQTGGEITIKQTGYINKILKESSMMESNDTKIPMDPGTKLVKAEMKRSDAKHYYRSLIEVSGTKEHGIIYKKEGGSKITGYSDSSYGVNTDKEKETTGIVFYFGESPITWCTQKQPTVALSSCESEFMAATRAACQVLWLKQLLSEITGWEEKRITLKVDNISAIALIRNPVFHGRSKHIDIRYHFIRECVEKGHINVEHVSGELQRADIQIKALPRLKFVTMRQNDRE
ncbi:zinc finger, CCHC-type containing protein [Tanacetum coccineum]